jgi:hypothetical protein
LIEIVTRFEKRWSELYLAYNEATQWKPRFEAVNIKYEELQRREQEWFIERQRLMEENRRLTIELEE